MALINKLINNLKKCFCVAYIDIIKYSNILNMFGPVKVNTLNLTSSVLELPD